MESIRLHLPSMLSGGCKLYQRGRCRGSSGAEERSIWADFSYETSRNTL